jgi:hypothetical protein
MLADAEAKGQCHPGDVLGTPEPSKQMSRPAAEPRASVVAAGTADADLVMAEKTEPSTAYWGNYGYGYGYGNGYGYDNGCTQLVPVYSRRGHYLGRHWVNVC